MNSKNDVKIDQDICRTCLSSNTDELLSIYQDDGEEVSIFDGVSIPQMITECTIHEVRADDLLPKMICLKCIEDVKVAYNFRKQTENSYKALNAFLIHDNDEDDDSNDTNASLDELPPLPPVQIEDLPPTEKCVQTDEVAFYPCERCESKFINYEALKEHRQTQHKNDEKKCRVCSKTYNRMSHLKRHIASSHPEIGVPIHNECKICNKRYTRAEHLKRHITQFHTMKYEQTEEQIEVTKKEKFHCQTCTKFFTNENDHECNKKDVVLRHQDKSCSSLPMALVEPEVSLMESKSTLEVLEATAVQLDCHDDYDNDYSTNDEEDMKPLAQLKAEAKNQATSNAIKTEPVSETSKRNENKINNSTKSNKSLKPVLKSMTKKTPKKHFCEKCNKEFSRSTHLKRHILTHSDKKPFLCDICHKGFTRIDHLNLHKLHHAEVKPFICDICNRGFIRAEHLRKHKEARHGNRTPNKKTEYCHVCKRFFSSAKYLQIHIKSHTERRYNCKHCEEIFNEKIELNEHMKIHSNEKPFLCSECGLRFVRNDYLVIHMRRHKGEKPYKCKYCAKGFPRATDLTVHERYHTGEKTHLCTICGKGFQRAYNLLVHMRVHTGERPYQCPHCSKCFAQGNDLKAHIRRHTGERFKCDVCGSGFIQGYHLTQHKRNAHGIETQSHIRRVEKFVTPMEQQKQVEALQNRIKESKPKFNRRTVAVTTTNSISNNSNTNNEALMTTPTAAASLGNAINSVNVTVLTTAATTTTVTRTAPTTVAASKRVVTVPTQTVLQIVDTSANEENNQIILEDEIKIEESRLENIETVQAQEININAADDNQLLHTTQYLVVEGSTFTPISTNTPIYFTEIDPKVKYETYD